MAETRRGAVADILFGGIAALVIVLLMQEAQDFAPRARLFPMAVLWVLLATAAVTAIMGLWRLSRAGLGPIGFDRSVLRLVGASALIAFGGVLLTWVGFYITSLVMILAVFLLHTALSEARAPSVKDLATGTVYAVAATGVMYLIFSLAIGLPAPRGALF